MKTDKINLDGMKFEGIQAETTKATLLMIKGSKGILGCAYFDIPTCNRLGEAAALVTGVKEYEQMYDAKIVSISKAAEELGIKRGMTGRQALKLLA